MCHRIQMHAWTLYTSHPIPTRTKKEKKERKRKRTAKWQKQNRETKQDEEERSFYLQISPSLTSHCLTTPKKARITQRPPRCSSQRWHVLISNPPIDHGLLGITQGECELFCPLPMCVKQEIDISSVPSFLGFTAVS